MSIAGIGGAIIVDGESVPLADALDLARLYAEASGRFPPGSFAAHLCAARGAAFTRAAEQAALWRRAGGWERPEDADQA